MKRHVFCVNTRRKLAVNIDATDFQLGHRHCLSRQNVTNLSGSDSESNCTKRTVRRRVRITASNRRSGLSNPLLRPNNVNNALSSAADIKKLYVEFFTVITKRIDHLLSQRIGKWLHVSSGRHDVIHRRKRPIREFHLQIKITQHSESLRTCHLMNQVRANKELGLPIGQGTNGVGIPHFFEKATRLNHEVRIVV